MSAIIYDLFFKRYGVKSPQYLMSPTMPSLERFSFPKNSIHHFAVYDNVSNGPASDEYVYRDISKKIYIEHALYLVDVKGSPKKLSVPLLPYIRDYHIKNKRFRRSENIVADVKDENTLAVINYGFVTKAYRYIRSAYTEYYKWWNIEKTVWDKVKHLAETSERQQFIFVDLPKTLPSVSKLDAYSGTFNQGLVKTFNTPEYLFLLEMWKWLGSKHRGDSILSGLTTEQYSKVNIVYRESGRFVLLNLGILDNWRFDKNFPKENQKIKIDCEAIQKRFLRMLMTLMETKTVAQVDEEPDEETVVGEDGDTVITQAPVASLPEYSDSDLNAVNVVGDNEVIDTETRLSISNKLLEDLDKDLEALEIIETQRANAIVIDDESSDTKTVKLEVSHKNKSIDTTFFDKDKTPEQIIEDICADLADDGLMSAAEYRKYLKNSENYKNILAPDGKTTLVDYIQIDPAVLKIESSASTVDRITITDKSMLKSSLLDFDEKYITKVMEKDIMSMGVAIQKAGLIINKYEVEDIEDILGKYQIHSIRVTPVEGTPSTLRFRLPIVDSDGSYTSNGVKYRMRKQRGDKRPLFYE